MGCWTLVADSSDLREGKGWSAFGFGLHLVGNLVIPSLPRDPVEPSGRTVRTARSSRRELDDAWRREASERLVERRLADGRVGMTVDRADDGSFRVWAPRHGCYHLSANGKALTGAPPAGPAWRWERLVLAQALPLSAALQGLEVLHASAVAVGDRVVAFMGRSGTGKTSIALHSVRRGGQLVTDDVLAVGLRDGVPVAFPGSTVARVDPMQLRALSRRERRDLGQVVARGEKQHVALRAATTSLPIGAIYHIVRPVHDVRDITISRPDPPDPLVLLGNAFLTYMQDARRLATQLEICATILKLVPVSTVQVPDRLSADEVAAALLRDVAAG